MPMGIVIVKFPPRDRESSKCNTVQMLQPSERPGDRGGGGEAVVSMGLLQLSDHMVQKLLYWNAIAHWDI